MSVINDLRLARLIPYEGATQVYCPVLSAVFNDKPLGQDHFFHLCYLGNHYGRLHCLDLWWDQQMSELGLAETECYVVFLGDHEPSLSAAAQSLREGNTPLPAQGDGSSSLERYRQPSSDKNWVWTWTVKARNPLKPAGPDNRDVFRLFG